MSSLEPVLDVWRAEGFYSFPGGTQGWEEVNSGRPVLEGASWGLLGGPGVICGVAVGL